MANNRADLFLEISALLTGFNKAELQGTGMVATYYNTVANIPQDPNYSDQELAANEANVGFFFEEVNSILKENKKDESKLQQAIAGRLMPLSAYNGLAQSIITLWYTGSWGANVVNAQAYIQGLMWDTAEAHPPGAKQPGFGSWSFPPL
ncbi:hypothetical protein BEL04_22185 [Mucilaginibacter sp. PPCGB 2223]|uniref:hypothetical protein n=1 Tax=Mucilaginibacter sp. PPCGB 2223 TaxID=1886027 RepID=UPI0008265F78|nr:hypothetical protein [Mucilaginibacter sp. PPCGB 2223]OCX50491.1 hypothetical protein BEL04_22185 [Mucilaginibacter sp. PPCGB 2223]